MQQAPSHPACSSHKQAAAPYQGGTKSTRTRSHSLKTVGGMAVQLPDALDHVPLVQVVVGKPAKPSLQVVLQEAPEAAGRGQAHAAPLVTLGLGWLVQSEDSRAAKKCAADKAAL